VGQDEVNQKSNRERESTMSGSVNEVILLGTLGKAPEIKHTQGGTAIARFSLATDQSWKDQAGEKQQRTEWHNVVAWRKLAEICGHYLTKGKQVYIEGKLQSRSWEKEGTKHAVTEIVADQLVMLGGKNGESAWNLSTAAGVTNVTSQDKNPEAELEITDEDIPFLEQPHPTL
jgi:single-strand DNA-binding protein